MNLLTSTTFLIFIGAGLGGIARYWFGTLIHTFLSRDFPYGTLSINVLGCLIMGFSFSYVLARYPEHNSLIREFFMVGFLGGFTTFSSFSLESFMLWERGAGLACSLYIILSMSLCLTACWLGNALMRYFP